MKINIDNVLCLVKDMKSIDYEKFRVICFDNNYTIRGVHDIPGKRDYGSFVFNIDAIFEVLNQDGCSKVVVIHNHPNNIAKPSEDDKETTLELIEQFKEKNIELIDHIIITDNDYFSFYKFYEEG